MRSPVSSWCLEVHFSDKLEHSLSTPSPAAAAAHFIRSIQRLLQSPVHFHASSHSLISLAFHSPCHSSHRYQPPSSSTCHLMTQDSPLGQAQTASRRAFWQDPPQPRFNSWLAKSLPVNVPSNPVVHASHKQIWVLAINHSWGVAPVLPVVTFVLSRDY